GAAGSAEGRLARRVGGPGVRSEQRADAGGDELQAGVGHLGRDRALPDQVVERALAAREPQLAPRAHRFTGGADRLVGLLRAPGPGGVPARFGAQVLLAVTPQDGAPAAVYRFL